MKWKKWNISFWVFKCVE